MGIPLDTIEDVLSARMRQVRANNNREVYPAISVWMSGDDVPFSNHILVRVMSGWIGIAHKDSPLEVRYINLARVDRIDFG